MVEIPASLRRCRLEIVRCGVAVLLTNAAIPDAECRAREKIRYQSYGFSSQLWWTGWRRDPFAVIRCVATQRSWNTKSTIRNFDTECNVLMFCSFSFFYSVENQLSRTENQFFLHSSPTLSCHYGTINYRTLHYVPCSSVRTSLL